MGFNKVYRSLFNVEILHHYFLDEGEWSYGFSPADVVETAAEKEAKEALDENLLKFRLSNFMDVQPTKRTHQILRNFRSKFIRSNTGIQVVTASDGNNPFIPFSSDLTFDFIIRITDPFFENYTNITIDRSEPLFLSNQTPLSSTKETAVPVRFCPLSEFATDLTNGTVPTLPMVKMNIDIDDIESRELLGAFAILRIHLVGEGNEINLTDIDKVGAAVDPNPNGATEFNGTLPEINLMFENRSTTWKYHRSKDSVQVHSSVGELPLTKHGYVSVSDGTNEYPNPSVKMIYDGEDLKYVDKIGTPIVEDITKKYSRVFI